MFNEENGKVVIVVGDTTDHGGLVITGNDMMQHFGKAVARIGDLVTCPKCEGQHTIVEGHQTINIMGRAVAFDGHLTSCGARLISQSRTPTVNFEMPPMAMGYVDSGTAKRANVYTISYGKFRHRKAGEEDIRVMINNNGIGHASVVVGTGNDAILYDPYGSYSGCFKRPCRKPNGEPIERGSGDVFYGDGNEFEFNDYLAYHLSDGPKVKVYLFYVPKSQANNIRKNIDEFGGAGFIQCATAVTYVLKKSGGEFSSLDSPWLLRSPWELEEQLLNILYPERGGVISPAY